MPIKILKMLIAISMVCFALLAVALVLIDPNDYRAQIEAKSLETAGLNIEINGALSWSFIPLGFEMHELKILDKNNTLFTQVDSVKLAVDTLSLLKLSPIVTGIYADGAQIKLTINEDGTSNWNNLLSTQSISLQNSEGALSSTNNSFGLVRVNTEAKPLTSKVVKGQRDIKPIIIIPARHVRINNVDIAYQNNVDQQNANISGLSLELRDVDVDKLFPVKMSFELSSDTQNLLYQHSLSADIFASSDLSNIRVSNFVNNIDVSGDFSNDRAIQLSLTGDLEYNVHAKHLSAESVQLSGAGLAVDTNFSLDHSGKALDLIGNVNVAPFSLSSVNTYLGLNLGVNNAAFRNVKLKTPFSLSKNRVRLSTFDLKVDQSQFIGQLQVDLNSRAVELTLKGDNIRIDNYVAALDANPEQVVQLNAPKHGSVLAALNSPNPATLQKQKPKALLPLSIIKTQNARVDFVQDKLQYQDYDISNASLSFEILNGQLNVTKANAQIFGGLVKTTAVIDVNGVPQWNIDSAMHNLDIAKIIASQPNTTLPLQPQGRLNLDAEIIAQGNSIDALLQDNKGKLYFEVVDGVLDGINFDEYLCKGLSLITKKTTASDRWTTNTNFETLSALNSLNDGSLNTQALTLQSGSLEVLGSGQLNMLSKDFQYDLDVKPKPNAISPACSVSPKFTEIAIPVACRGATNGVEPVSCRLNQSRLTDISKVIAKAEASRKIEKEVDRALEKKLNKYLDKDSEAAKQIKESILGLFE